MKHVFLLILSLALTLPMPAQTRKGSAAHSATKAKTTATQKKTTKATPQKSADRKAQLKKEQAATAKARQQSQAKLAQLNKNVKAGLDSVMALDYQIGRRQKEIDSLNREIRALNNTIYILNKELAKLKRELEAKKKNYAKALVYMRKNRSVQNKLMFLFSAENFTQMARRLRYMREYSMFQRVQGELLKEKQREVQAKQNELLAAKTQKEDNLHRLEKKKEELKTMQERCKSQVSYLNKNISTVKQQIQDYQKKEKSLNAEIDRIIQEEIEAARRAEEERKRKAEAEAREKARKLAEAKAAAERARKAAEEAEAARKSARTAEEKAAAKAAAERAKREAKAAEADVKAAEKEEKVERAKYEAWKSSDASANTKLSSDFASNKGRLPIPITGNYNIVSRFGNYQVAGLSHVTLDNKGIDIRGQQGCSARAVFDGTVSSVFQYDGAYIVMLRHGSYISVYSGLSSVAVSKGQKVKTRATLGSVRCDADGRYILHFQLRKETVRLNPEQWVR